MTLVADTGLTAPPAATGLAATRALGVLDERCVPYVHPSGDTRSRGWQCLCGPDPDRALHWWGGRGEAAAHYELAGVPVWGRVAPDSEMAEHAASLGGEWAAREPILHPDGAPHASVWRSAAGGTILPFDPDDVVLNYRSERYQEIDGAAALSLKAVARRVYYAVRPLLPRPLQIAVRRAFSRVQARAVFPRWPLEPAMHELSDQVLGWAADALGEPLPYLEPWPDGRAWALVLTHDVEKAAGRDAIERVRAVEERHGFRSSWNLVPERYTVPDALVAHLGAEGCEVGVHGLRHDGRDLESLTTLGRRLPEIRRWAARWGATGFRAPATHRVWEWMPRLGFDYDSSYPDTDPYEPVSGGCCSWLPFFNDTLVELPITLPQDHTVFVILRRDEGLWHEKAEALRRRGGMALLITHPDYMLDAPPLDAYERFLVAYRDDATAWAALPREVADWWRRRAATAIRREGDGTWRAEGPAAARATIGFAVPDAGLTDRPVGAGSNPMYKTQIAPPGGHP